MLEWLKGGSSKREEVLAAEAESDKVAQQVSDTAAKYAAPTETAAASTPSAEAQSVGLSRDPAELDADAAKRLKMDAVKEAA